MGWTCEYNAKYHKPNGSVDRKKCLDAILTWENKSMGNGEYVGFRILKSAMVGREYYAACEKYLVKEGKEERMCVFAFICLTCGKGRDGTEWGYKDMEENCGPYYTKCPNSILDLLTPAQSEWASEWRERCREYHKQKKENTKSNADDKLVPPGVLVTRNRGNWVLFNEIVRRSGYDGIRFSKRTWGTLENAMRRFLEVYGTRDQRRFFAESGKDCPEKWKKGIA